MEGRTSMLVLICVLPLVIAARLPPLVEEIKIVQQQHVTFPRPDPNEHAKMARWLVHANSWGTLSSLGAEDGRPFGGVVSYSDGSVMNPTGRLIFYLTPMDQSTQNIEKEPAAGLTITESQQLPHGCGQTDPEDPTCAKLSISGNMQLVPESEQSTVKQMLFSRHPAMAKWPADHQFTLYEMQIESLMLLDWYGGAHIITPEEYFQAELSPDDS
eukprot:jgi/Chrzof1/14424/Cz09g02120.t1